MWVKSCVFAILPQTQWRLGLDPWILVPYQSQQEYTEEELANMGIKYLNIEASSQTTVSGFRQKPW